MSLLEGMGTTDLAPVAEDKPRGLPVQFGDNERVGEKIQQARDVSVLIEQARTYINTLPKSKSDARREQALSRFAESFCIEVPSCMTQEQYQAAMLIGSGLSHVEAADAVGITRAELYGAMDREFTRVMRFWRERTFEEYFSGMIRMIDHLLETVTDPEQLIKMLKPMMEMAGKVEDRERWETEIMLREREIRAKEQDADTYASAVQLSSVVRPQTLGKLDAVIDIPFEAEDGEDEEEDAV